MLPVKMTMTDWTIFEMLATSASFVELNSRLLTDDVYVRCQQESRQRHAHAVATSDAPLIGQRALSTLASVPILHSLLNLIYVPFK